MHPLDPENCGFTGDLVTTLELGEGRDSLVVITRHFFMGEADKTKDEVVFNGRNVKPLMNDDHWAVIDRHFENNWAAIQQENRVARECLYDEWRDGRDELRRAA